MDGIHKEDRGTNGLGQQLYNISKRDDLGNLELDIDIIAGDFLSVNFCKVEAVPLLLRILQHPVIEIACLKKT